MEGEGTGIIATHFLSHPAAYSLYQNGRTGDGCKSITVHYGTFGHKRYNERI